MQVLFHFMQSSDLAFSKDLLVGAKPVWRVKEKPNTNNKKEKKTYLNEQATGIQ